MLPLSWNTGLAFPVVDGTAVVVATTGAGVFKHDDTIVKLIGI